MNLEESEIICTDRIKPRKIKSQNIVDRLRNREHFGNLGRPGKCLKKAQRNRKKYYLSFVYFDYLFRWFQELNVTALVNSIRMSIQTLQSSTSKSQLAI